MDNNDTTAASDSKKVKEKLDAILERNLRKLDQISVLGKDVQLDMVTVAALHLLVEREGEIEDDELTKKQRYTRKAFLNDLTEIGFEIDDELMKKIQAVLDNGCVVIDGAGAYHAQMAAKDVVGNINKMFPGMPGMNLIAYVIQTMEEILTGRKDLDKGVDQFDKALQSRGRPLTFVHLRTEKKTESQKAQERLKRAQEREESRKASEKLKVIYSEKIASLRKTLLREKEEPMVVTRRALGADDIQIKEVSPQKIREAQERERLEQERLERERLEKEREELERQKQELERLAREQEEKDRLERERQEQERREQERQEALAREEQERLRLEQEVRERLERERLEKERLEAESSDRELSIEEQIAAFEREQAVTCPLCHTGKILQETTDSNRTYYKCSNPVCKFISWDKPHLFACPQCRNPYLLEFHRPDGTVGLKCPLATCSYSQAGLGRPGEAPPPQAATPTASAPDGAAPKKKRLVRRRRS
ncbi:hypothetical protein JCM14469_26440 [Desulfatiferula olefinivorans]